MSKRAIRSAEDLEELIQAFNDKDWDKVLSYLSDDCVWDASEKRLHGLSEIMGYWTGYHSAIKETLGKPRNVVFGDGVAYAQVTIELEFVSDGTFFGHSYKKGSVVELPCADFYTFAEDGTIKECRVYTKFKQG